VNGPLPFKVSTKPAALTAATKVVCAFEFMAFSTTFFLANMASPPTITVLAPWALRENVTHARIKERAKFLIENFMIGWLTLKMVSVIVFVSGEQNHLRGEWCAWFFLIEKSCRLPVFHL
jgi:hypothetical protein